MRRKSKILQHHSPQLGLYWKQARVPAPQVDQPLQRHCGKSGGTRNTEEQPSPSSGQTSSVCTDDLFSPAVFQSYKKGLKAGMQRAIGQSASADIQQVVSKQAHQKGQVEHVKLDSLLFSAPFRSPSTCFHFKKEPSRGNQTVELVSTSVTAGSLIENELEALPFSAACASPGRDGRLQCVTSLSIFQSKTCLFESLIKI